jgi:hypothetical protein
LVSRVRGFCGAGAGIHPNLVGLADCNFFKIIEMLKDKKAVASREQHNKSKEFFLSEDALLKEMTVAEIERANMVIDPMDATPNVPFGHLNALWAGFRDGLEPDETVHLFDSVGPNSFRRQLILGYAVCKAGRIDRFMTAGWRR